MDFDPIERYYDMSSEAVSRVQEKKLRDFIRYQLYPFSPYYRKLFDDNKIDPNSIQTVKDLEMIPLTTKEDIMPTEDDPKRYKQFILQPDLDLITKFWPKTELFRLKLKDLAGTDLKKELSKDYYPNFMIATSGTMGGSVPFMFTSRDIKQFSNAYTSILDVVGLNDGQVVLNTFPFAPNLAFVFVYWVNLNSTIRFFHTGGDAVMSTEKTVELINEVDADVLIGVPSYLYHILRKAQKERTDLSSIKMVLSAGEKLSKGTRMKIEAILEDCGATDIEIFDVYGTTEMRDAYSECVPGSGVFHIHPNIHIAEIVDPKTGKQKKSGERGALAVTNIDGRGTVLCRFLVGDIFEGGIRYGPCPHCGMSTPRLVGPIGRIGDHSMKMDLVKDKGTFVNLNSLHDILPEIDGIVEWQVSIEKRNNDPSGLDVMKINIAVENGTKKAELAEKIKKKVNESTDIDPIVDTSFNEDDLFEMMGGNLKPKRIIDNRPRE